MTAKKPAIKINKRKEVGYVYLDSDYEEQQKQENEVYEND